MLTRQLNQAERLFALRRRAAGFLFRGRRFSRGGRLRRGGFAGGRLGAGSRLVGRLLLGGAGGRFVARGLECFLGLLAVAGPFASGCGSAAAADGTTAGCLFSGPLGDLREGHFLETGSLGDRDVDVAVTARTVRSVPRRWPPDVPSSGCFPSSRTGVALARLRACLSISTAVAQIDVRTRRTCGR